MGNLENFKKFFLGANGYGPRQEQTNHFLSLGKYDQNLVIETLKNHARQNDLAIANRNSVY